jgi:Family of unknown function (DUF5763)
VRYCPDHDPIIVAGIVTCRRCQGCAYPVSAGWIDDRLILASFGPVDGESECPGSHKPRTLLIDVCTDNTAIPQAPDRRSAQIAQWCGTTCTATTSSGERCRNRPKADGLCGTHLAQREYRARKQAR